MPCLNLNVKKSLFCSEFIWEVRHLDECWHLLVHLSGFYQHEKQFAAAQAEAGQHTVTKPGNRQCKEAEYPLLDIEKLNCVSLSTRQLKFYEMFGCKVNKT